jgi:addiction module HigA family antidote
VAQPTHRAPTTPGEILLEDWLTPMSMTQGKLAEKMGVPIQLVNGIINGRRAVTASSALKLSEVLGTTPEFWLAAQNAIDLYEARQALANKPLRPRESFTRKASHVPARALGQFKSAALGLKSGTMKAAAKRKQKAPSKPAK